MNSKPNLSNVFSNPAKLIILVQSTIIAFLSIWIYEEYLNNTYLQTYVNGSLQTVGIMIVVLSVVCLLATVTAFLFRKKRAIEATVEPISREIPAPVAEATIETPKPDQGLHPAVASLKAELRGAHIPVGLQLVPKQEETASTGPQLPVVTSSTPPNVPAANAPPSETPTPTATPTTTPNVPSTTAIVKKEPEKPTGETPPSA